MSIIVPHNLLTLPRAGETAQAPVPDARAYPPLPDLGNRRYRNPVLAADYSDPHVIRDRDRYDFYLTAFSFNCVPGLPPLHSRNFVNWRIVNHALPRLPRPRYDQVQHGCVVWARSSAATRGTFGSSSRRRTRGLLPQPNLLLQKLQARSQFITTRVHLLPGDVGVTAGLIVTGLERASLALRSSPRSAGPASTHWT